MNERGEHPGGENEQGALFSAERLDLAKKARDEAELAQDRTHEKLERERTERVAERARAAEERREMLAGLEPEESISMRQAEIEARADARDAEINEGVSSARRDQTSEKLVASTSSVVGANIHEKAHEDARRREAEDRRKVLNAEAAERQREHEARKERMIAEGTWPEFPPSPGEVHIAESRARLDEKQLERERAQRLAESIEADEAAANAVHDASERSDLPPVESDAFPRRSEPANTVEAAQRALNERILNKNWSEGQPEDIRPPDDEPEHGA